MLRAAMFALALAGMGIAPAQAAGLNAVQTVEVATVSVDASGEEKLTFEPAAEVEPGEQVRYTLAFTNDGDTPAENVNLIMPVPAEVILLDGSIQGAQSLVTFSADQGVTFASRETTMVSEDETTRVATAAEITHIQWAFAEAVEIGASGTISFMAVLK